MSDASIIGSLESMITEAFATCKRRLFGTPGQSVSTVGVRLPPDFPAGPYQRISNRLSGKKDTHFGSWSEFACAWNAVAYRFLSCTEYDAAFTKSVKRFTNSPPHDEWYRQQRDLFGFFVTGVSVIESLCYGLFAVGSILTAQNFPFATSNDRKYVYPETTADKFGKVFPSEGITATLKRMIDTKDYQDLKGMRNILSHRSTPSRRFYKGGANDGDVLWGDMIPINQDTTCLRRRWLVGMLGDLLDAADSFTAARLV